MVAIRFIIFRLQILLAYSGLSISYCTHILRVMDKKVLFDSMISTIVWSAAALLHIQQTSLVKGRGRLEGPLSLG